MTEKGEGPAVSHEASVITPKQDQDSAGRRRGRRPGDPGFVQLRRDRVRELQSDPDVRRSRFTLIYLLIEADHRTGFVAGSRRELARRAGIRPGTFFDHVDELQKAGLVEVVPARNQFDGSSPPGILVRCYRSFVRGAVSESDTAGVADSDTAAVTVSGTAADAVPLGVPVGDTVSDTADPPLPAVSRPNTEDRRKTLSSSSSNGRWPDHLAEFETEIRRLATIKGANVAEIDALLVGLRPDFEAGRYTFVRPGLITPRLDVIRKQLRAAEDRNQAAAREREQWRQRALAIYRRRYGDKAAPAVLTTVVDGMTEVALRGTEEDLLAHAEALYRPAAEVAS